LVLRDWEKGATMKKVLLLILLAVAVAGCGGQIYEKDPVGIGYDQNELKLSPCACMQVYRG
jgi:hypothetical protein